MSDFHMTLNPGVLTSLKQVITIAIDAPESATGVKVTLWEADRWRSGNTEVKEGPKAEPVAQFRGHIKDGKFQGEISPRGKTDKKADKKAPKLKVQFDGSKQVHELPLAGKGNEVEQGVYEITASIRGKLNGKKKDYSIQAPVFVRNFDNSRPVLALIAGRDAYKTDATAYWKAHADGTFNRWNLQDALKFLREAPTARGYGTWGEVNIVSHGNEWEWIIWLFNTRKNNPNHLKASVLRKHQENAALLPRPDATHLDQKSKVVLRGCVMGDNQPLLDQIRVLFGDRAFLLAPRYLQLYGKRNGLVVEGFWIQHYVYVRSRKAPSDAEGTRLLLAKYDELDKAEINRRIGFKKLDAEQTGRMTHTHTVEGEGILTKAQATKEIRGSFESLSRDERFGTDWDDWLWEVSIQKSEKGAARVFRAVGIGRRYRFEIRRPYLDGDKKPVVPTITDKTHFGRSPAWPPDV